MLRAPAICGADGRADPDAPDWSRDGKDWPNAAASRFVEAGGIRWHVQVAGDGPVLLLVHGTGAATHSWRDLLPLLTPHFTVIAPDLPGHGFSQRLRRRSVTVEGIGEALGALLVQLDMQPEIALGHSAGAAILAAMAIDSRIEPRLLVSVNGALMPFQGLAGFTFSPVARLLSATSLAPRLFAWGAADPAAVRRLIERMGSQIDREGLVLYTRLLRRSGHVAGAVDMMAGWDLERLARALPSLKPKLVLVAGSRDTAVPPRDAERIRERVPGSELEKLDGLGHLAHEERPDAVAGIVLRHARIGDAGGGG
ncbi:MAG: alpha/beta fold hydrolase BchO [Minwuia sp.]|uniref:alpha/beta fold hydrolase BchO n=1 Tax=Minwuia sp. TaxID=2493630 RepID=UPI003A88D0E8